MTSKAPPETKTKRRQKTENYSDAELRRLDTDSPFRLILTSISVFITSGIAIYGVTARDWPPFSLLVLFLVEGFIVIGTDAVKLPFRHSGLMIEKNFRKSGPMMFFFECIFMGLFGFIILMALGPRQSDSLVPGEVLVPALNLITGDLRWPVIFLLILRFQRLVQDFLAAGALSSDRSFPLSLSGGGWMLLLFFLGILMPFLASDEPDAFIGLIVLIILKTLGEIFGIWAIKLALLIPDKRRQ